MTTAQINIICQMKKITEPLETHVNNLRELCKDERRKVAKDFLLMYEAELLEYKKLEIMLMEEFNK